MPRTLNKTVYTRLPENILSKREVVQIWEKLTGKDMSSMEANGNGTLLPCFKGCLANFDIGEGVEVCGLVHS
ncbi:hypothetical protein GYH30_044223 [Glycine max]|uniref:Uncharacterized protein n=2 Tax=Glycine subgen. Soja TaxID=1462606 RepID=K7MFC1_SOYBN|nr:hypothetical protein GYH30_044223 [Glycine max]RZB59710.1 Bifunctional pinoresinol-lariciresinol reductase 2 [Glycine soja]